MKKGNLKRMVSVLIVTAILLCTSVFAANALEITEGTYQVNIKLWHSEDDKESMAASAIDSTAVIVVEKGVKTMHIKTGEMSMMGINASLQELRVADQNGNYTDATVEATNENGDPTGFYFTLPHTEEYITVLVNPHIALMGNKDIGARIKVDYSTLIRMDSSETTKTETVAQTQTQTTAQETENATQEVQEIQTTQSVETTQAITESVVEVESTESVETVNQIVTTTQPSSDSDTSEKSGGMASKIIIAAVIVLVFACTVTGIVVYKEKKEDQ